MDIYIPRRRRRCCPDLCKRRWFTSGAFLRDGRKTLETVLGEHVDTSVMVLRCERKAWRYGSKFFDGGKVTSNTHNSCQPRNVLSL